MILSICDSSTLKIGCRRQPIFWQKLKGIMKQKADVADTLTVTVKVPRGSYTTTQQFCHLRVEKMQMHEGGGETYPEKKDWRLHNGVEMEACWVKDGKQINKTGRPWKVTSEPEPHFFRHPIHFIVTSSIPHQQPAVSPTKSHPD